MIFTRQVNTSETDTCDICEKEVKTGEYWYMLTSGHESGAEILSVTCVTCSEEMIEAINGEL